MIWTSDPERDADRYLDRLERDWERRMKHRPDCAICGERIEDDYAYCINGEWYHEECIEDCQQKFEDDYFEDDYDFKEEQYDRYDGFSGDEVKA